MHILRQMGRLGALALLAAGCSNAVPTVANPDESLGLTAAQIQQKDSAAMAEVPMGGMPAEPAPVIEEPAATEPAPAEPPPVMDEPVPAELPPMVDDEADDEAEDEPPVEEPPVIEPPVTDPLPLPWEEEEEEDDD